MGDDFPVESDVLDAFGAGGATPLPLLSFLLLFFLPEVDDAKFAAGFDESFDVPLTEEIERLLNSLRRLPYTSLSLVFSSSLS